MNRLLLSPLAVAIASLTACGSSYYAQPYQALDPAPAPPAYPAPQAQGYGGSPAYGTTTSDVEVAYAVESVAVSRGGSSSRGRSSRAQGSGASGSPAQYAQAVSPPPATAPDLVPIDNQTVSDGTQVAPEQVAQLLVYTAGVTLAIFEVEETQEAILAHVVELGGYASHRDTYAITLRVPAETFQHVLEFIESAGDVLAMSWQAEEVSEEYRDLDIRLRNALDMRERLAALLERAETVPDALAIEEQLRRLTLEIEQYRGQLRSLMDRVAFSTITIRFQQLQQSNVPTNEYLLPFSWLNTVGLEYLLAL